MHGSSISEVFAPDEELPVVERLAEIDLERLAWLQRAPLLLPKVDMEDLSCLLRLMGKPAEE